MNEKRTALEICFNKISGAVLFSFIPLHTFNFSSSKTHFSNRFFRFSNKLLPVYDKAYYIYTGFQ